MKIKTSDLTGAALDWAVCAALAVQFNEGRVVKVCRHEATTPAWIERENSPGSAPHYHRFGPSTAWAQGGPIIEREDIDVLRDGQEFGARKGSMHKHPHRDAWVWSAQRGPTKLIAAMRCYVASQLGDEVDVPEELCS